MRTAMKPSSRNWAITVLGALALGIVVGNFVGIIRSVARGGSPPIAVRETGPAIQGGGKGEVGVENRSDGGGSNVHNPYPYYSWWPEFNSVVMNSKAMEGVQEGNKEQGKKVDKVAIEDLLYSIDKYVALHPPENDWYTVTERPTPLTFDCNSPKYSGFLRGSARTKPAKIAWAFQFAGEFQLLDIAMYELDGAVDYYVLYEANFVHRFARKPLYFERHKYRYKRFLDRVVHLVADDAFSQVSKLHNPTIDDFVPGLDSQHHVKMTEKLKTLTDVLSPDDFVLMGDLDEIPDVDFIYHLKHCEVNEANFPTYSNTVFYMADFRNLFKSDHPPRRGFTYGHKFPNIYLMKDIQDRGNLRDFDLRVESVPPIGGYHLSTPAIVPYLLVKFFGASEYGGGPPTNNMTAWSEMYRNRSAMELMGFASRIIGSREPLVPKQYKDAIHLPWLVEHNKDKFPFLFLDMPAVNIQPRKSFPQQTML